MRKRPISIIILVVAFLFSAWGNIIAAALCPRYLSNRSCCLKHEARQPEQVDRKSSSCQQETADMEMGDVQKDGTEMRSEAVSGTSDNSIAENPPIEIATESSAEQVVVNIPVGECAHCWMHSQPSSGIVTASVVDPSKRLVETNAPTVDIAVALPSFSVSITPLEHGPPATSFPRHLLIKVFRI